MSKQPNPFIDDAAPIPPHKPKPGRKPRSKPNGNGDTPQYVPPHDLHWRALLEVTDKGQEMRILLNAMIALRHADVWHDVLAFDAFANRFIVQKELPDSPTYPGLTTPRELTETDISNTTAWLQRRRVVVPSTVTLEAIKAVAVEHSFHPVREYLAGLAWDGTPRLDLWLTDHLGAENTELNRAVGSKWMIGLVARVMRPGCQFDTTLICESTQGRGKSSAFRALSEPWFTDHLPDITSKDAQQQVHGVWVVELSELDSFRRAEGSRIKSFLSLRVDRFRPSYGRIVADHPRQCGFAGSVNPSDANGYLRDETGARRFWCVACSVDDERIDIPALKASRDQLWAEAVVRFKAGEAWYLDNLALEAAQEEAAEERQEDDPRERRIQNFVRGRPTVHMADILEQCLEIPVDRWTRALRTEIGIIMAHLKWRRRLVRNGKEREWRYEPPR